MLATICFQSLYDDSFLFEGDSGEKYEKEGDSTRNWNGAAGSIQVIVSLYNENSWFRHDYAGMLTSFQTAINTQDIKN